MSVKEKLTAIAESIRSKTGKTESLNLDDMAGAVDEVFDIGKEQGKQAWYDAFWDSFQNKGTRQSHELIFAGGGWSPNNFKPKYPIKPTSARMMFYRAVNLTVDLEAVVNIDFSNCTDFTQTFQAFAGTRLGVIDLRKATDITNAFVWCENMVTIDKVIVDESLPGTLNFANDTVLKNIVIEGILVKSVSAAKSPLSVESLKSIITHLKDYSQHTANHYKYTVTFMASVFEALETTGFTDADKEWLTAIGLAYSEDTTWATVIDDLKWNLTLA